MPMTFPRLIPQDLQQWLQSQAEPLDQEAGGASALLPALARSGLLGLGVPQQQGGVGGSAHDALEAIAQVAEVSLTAAFVFWGQRALIDYLLRSDNPLPRERWLADLLSGRLAGAVGLSNVMKFLAQIEPLQVHAAPAADGWRLQGVLPWVSNLRPEGFVVVAAVQRPDQPAPMVVAIESRLDGVQRSADLALLGMRASNTAAIALEDVAIDAAAVLAPQAPPYLRMARPPFLAMQCALSLGLVRASLRAARSTPSGRVVLQARLEAVEQGLAQATAALHAGLADQRFVADVTALFVLRMRLAQLVQEAVQLELQAWGGRAYLDGCAPGFARRWREAAFIPVITPSLTQLQAEIDRQPA